MICIDDLVEVSKQKDANISMLLETAYKRGRIDGKEMAKKKIIEAIIEEK